MLPSNLPTAADIELMNRFAKELVAHQPDLIIFVTSTPATAAMVQATRTIPVIFVLVADPVGSGFVASLPWPGGNVTGFTPRAGLLGGKWAELVKEIAPGIAQVTCCLTRRRRRLSRVIRTRSKQLLPPSACRRLLHPLMTCANSKRSLRFRQASRIVVWSYSPMPSQSSIARRLFRCSFAIVLRP